MRVRFLVCVFSSLIGCASEPVSLTDADLVASARQLSSERGISFWKALATERVNVDLNGRKFREVFVYSQPEKNGRLCKSKVYIFQVFPPQYGIKWNLVDDDESGYSSIAASVVGDGNASCQRLSLKRYFDAHDPIDNNTLIAIFSSLEHALKSGHVSDVDKDDFSILSISLSVQPGVLDGYIYKARVMTGIPRRFLTIHIDLESAEFSIRSGS